VAPAALGLPVPIDPGPHRVEATAPGAATFATTVAVEPGAEACPTRTVEIPALTSARTVDVAPLPKPSYWRPIHTAALVTATAGVVVVVLGSAFGLQAASMKSDADAACTSAGCSAEGKSLLHDAGQRADVATVTLVIGAALLTTSAVLWLVSPSLRPSPVATTAGLRF
jgi:hypothetical protein